MNKHERALTVLVVELNTLCGKAFARFLMEHDNNAKQGVEAAEFMERLMGGGSWKTDEHYLKPYLEPIQEILETITTLKSL